MEVAHRAAVWGPLLWLLIVDTAIKKQWGKNFRIQVFVDDFILIIRAKTKDELVTLANKIIKDFNE